MRIRVAKPISLFCGLFLVLVFPSTGSAFLVDWLFSGGITYLVGRGLIGEANRAVDETIDRADKAVEARMKQGDDIANRSIAQAGDELRKTIREAGKELKSAIKELEDAQERRIDQIDKKLKERTEDVFKKLDAQQRDFFLQADALQQKVSNNLNDIVDGALNRGETALAQTVIVLQNLRLTPLGADKDYKVCHTLGQYQTFKTSGMYYIMACGYGLSENYNVDVTMKGERVEKIPFTAPFTRVVGIPVEKVNLSFKNEEPYPVDLEFASKEIGKQPITIVLLPKFPVKYRLYGIDSNGKEHRVLINSLGKDFIDVEERLFKKARKTTDDFAQHLAKLREITERRLRFGSHLVDWPDEYRSARMEVEWPNSGTQEFIIGLNGADRNKNVQLSFDAVNKKMKIDVKLRVQYDGPPR